MILLIDNYDSFVYNLSRYLEELGCETRVARNDALSVTDVERLSPQGIVLSPGPCTPREAGISMDVVRRLEERIPILGVCLGHQAIAMALGGRVVRAPEPVHGMLSLVEHEGSGLFRDVSNPFRAGRYHSLVVEEASLPEELAVTARVQGERVIMGLEHRTRPLFGVQFHPESVLTFEGRKIVENFVRICGIPVQSKPSEEIPAPSEAEEGAGGCAIDPQPMFW